MSSNKTQVKKSAGKILKKSNGNIAPGVSRMLDASRMKVLPRESFNASTDRTNTFLRSLKTLKVSGLMKKSINLFKKKEEYNLLGGENKENNGKYTPGNII